MSGTTAMPRARWSALLLASAAIFLLPACETLPEASKKLTALIGIKPAIRAGELPARPADRIWPDATLDVRNQRARGYGLVDMPEMQTYLSGLLQKVKQSAGVADWPGAVYLTAATELEAYSTGAGNVYVSLPWLKSMESEDEMIALLAHELGHVYMDSHKLESTITTSDDMAKWTGVAVALARKAGSATGWTQVDSLMAAYEFGKNTLAPAWGRNEEENADTFGATISLQLGYSFPSGYKAFLERMATWEADNKKQRETERATLLAQLKAASAESLRKQNTVTNSAQINLQDAQIEMNAGLIEMSHNVSGSMSDLIKKVRQSHPDVEARLTSLTEQVQPLMAGKPRPTATVQPWKRALAQPKTAAVLMNYQRVTDAQAAIQQQDFRGARKLALEAASGPTAQHALPALMMDLTDNYAEPNAARMRKLPAASAPPQRRVDPLERNLKSEPDRAWRLYVIRANQLLGAGQTAQAKAVMVDGFGYFDKAPAAWPDAIAFSGQAEGWDKAKEMAQTCAKRFPSSASSCQQAAASPQDIAVAAKNAEDKAKSITDKWLKK